jgi:uncharacterized membrane protein
LLATSVAFDLLWYAGRDAFAATAGHLMAAGVITGPIAAQFGWIDWAGLPLGTRARRLGLLHGLGNMAGVALFAVSLLLRLEGWAWDPEPLVLSLAGAGIAVVTAWVGGELVERLGVAVHGDAHLDAPSCLSTLGGRGG